MDSSMFWDDMHSIKSNDSMDFLHHEINRSNRSNRSNRFEIKQRLSITDILDKNESEKNKLLNFDGDDIKIREIPERIKTFDWVESIIIDSTSIEFIEYMPPNVTKVVIKNNNNLQFFDASILPDCVKILNCFNNNIREIIGLKNGINDLNLSANSFIEINCEIPESVTVLDISANSKLEKIPKLYNDGENIITINMSNTSITTIDHLHDNIVKIEACRCNISVINKLPKKLTNLKAYISTIEAINCEFPEFIEEADLYNNSIVACASFPKTIKYVDLSYNNLTTIPIVHIESDGKIDIKFNKFLNDSDIIKFVSEHPKLEILHDAQQQVTRSRNIPSFIPSGDIDSSPNLSEMIQRMRQSGSMSIKRILEKSDKSEKMSKSNPHFIVLNKTFSF
jgi:hypothetical protein